MSTKQLTLPVTGMTCANCVAAVERNAKKVTGVSEAVVNFASERVTISYDPELANPQAVIERIEKAGYGVPTATLELPLTGMTCTNCANTIQRRLRKTDGVLKPTSIMPTKKRRSLTRREPLPVLTWSRPCARRVMMW